SLLRTRRRWCDVLLGLEAVWPARRWDDHQPQYTRIGIRRDQLHERERRGRAYVRPRDDRDRLLLGPQLGRTTRQPFAQTDARARARFRAVTRYAATPSSR